MSTDSLTPMMQQYHRLKAEIPRDAILLFRLGDFYEMFYDDAKISSQLLNLTLTQRQGVPMAGVPHHALENYLNRFLRAGKRVAICDQMETPRPGHVVKRQITKVLSPGSVIEGSLIEAKQNNFCAALWQHKAAWGMAYLDLSTGEFCAGEMLAEAEVRDFLAGLRPSELVMPVAQKASFALDHKLLIVGYEDWAFTPEAAEFTLRDHFKTQSLDGFGLNGFASALGAAGGLLHYLAQELRRDLSHVGRITTLQRRDALVIDAVTQQNLDLVHSSRLGEEKATLLTAIDRTVTAGGGRLLRQWLLQPLNQPERIRARHEAVAFYKTNESERERLRDHLREIRDLERLIGRLSQGSGNGRDLLALKISLQKIPALKELLAKHPPALIQKFAAQLTPLPELIRLYETALADEPPLALKEGGIIRAGYRVELDELRSASTQGKEWLAQLQLKEQERTGIKSLKVRYNQVFGYYIEITAANLGSVPADYTRKQTLANAERFITPELKEMESKILGAEERSRQLEYEIFLELRLEAVKQVAPIQATAQALHAVDILTSWGALAQEQDYVQPEITEDGILEIEEGRHPVLEQLNPGEKFVPNDARLDPDQQRLIILTGPNMAGKSTFIRQVALIAILAHCGCFVPARRARIGILDRVFTRVGASDNLSRGQSTFMVEMNETANILNHATRNSLVILDEIGRGTSTFDGLSIAWSVAEHFHNVIGAKTLFATHYHELTELALILSGAKNFNVAVREWGEQVVFLRKIIPGGADKSYGIQVARLAGLPPSVLSRAKEILRQLEDAELDEKGKPKLGKTASPKTRSKKVQESLDEMDLFTSKL